jgi:threonine dehydrogenase-like Zn-dependent dehydrogenase
MQALTFRLNVPVYLLAGALAARRPRVLFSGWAPVQMREVPEPALPGEEWVKIRPVLAGLCGSDLSLIRCHQSRTLQFLGSSPFVMGHEVCGEIVEMGKAVEGFEVGERVTVMPHLACAARGIIPPCPFCASGRPQLCENFTVGLEPGLHVGVSAAATGYISEMGVAHASGLFKVPMSVSDENAMLVEPLATCLHMVIMNRLAGEETVMVVGCGMMGLGTIAALRALHPGCRIIAVEIDPFHSQVARDMGADEVMEPGGKDFYRRIADLTGAKMFAPLMAKPILVGGIDRVFDTVGSTQTIDDSLRVLVNGGWLSLLGIGMPGKIDWTPVWLKELTIRGIYCYQEEEWRGETIHDFALALRLFEEGKLDLSHLVTHKFRLDQWHDALHAALEKGGHHAIKVAFVP